MSTDNPLAKFVDIHAHSRCAPDIICSVEPDFEIESAYGQAWYSVGIHPWSTVNEISAATIENLLIRSRDIRVVAIGECGLDKNRGGRPDYQEEIFRLHIDISESLQKPLIIHCVGRYGRLLDLYRETAPTQQWVIHGFSGKAELARQLIAAGFYISLGPRSNSSLRAIIPKERRYEESDA
ncbi:MAG: TatD family hydrolase [Muribaculaceae bacterium]|nr:TatD family hydrolase [Muribaculaceae bacterium]